jgi:hypothetical protein
VRTGVDAPTLALYESGVYDTHSRIKVANGSGTLINLQGRFTSYQVQQPNPNAPVAGLTVELLRELGTPASSLAPKVSASTFNKLDDAVTYSPLLQIGRAVTKEIALTAQGGARPADGSSLWYEVFRGVITAVTWPKYDSRKCSITCGDRSAVLKLTKSETAYTYAAGTSIEDAIQAVLTNNGIAYTFSCPVATGKVLASTYAPGRQKPVWDQVQALAQSIAWLCWFRYTSTSTLNLTLFSPARSKVVADLTQPFVWDWDDLSVNQEEIRGVGFASVVDENGTRREVGPAENATSIAKYGGIRRAFWIVLNEDSPVRNVADATDMLTDAMSDVSDPDTLAAALVPCPVFAESGVDLYEFPADERFFDSAQLMAPFGITWGKVEDQDAVGTLTLRGAPSAGTRLWLGKVEIIPPEDARYRAVYDVREDVSARTATHRLILATVGPGVEEVWGAHDTVASETDEAWAAVAAAVDYLADDLTAGIWIPIAVEGEVVLLQLEGRYVDEATNALASGPVHRSAWGAGGVREGEVMAAASETTSTATLWWDEQTAGVVVTAREVYYRIGRTGTRLGPFAVTRDSGDASTVQGGTLSATQFEYDTALPTTGIVVVEVDITYDTGRTRTAVVMPFDRGLDPAIIDVVADDTALTVKVLADSDTKSLRLISTDGNGIDLAYDGQSKTFGPIAVTASEEWHFEVRAYRLPVVQQSGAAATDYDDRAVSLNNGAGAPAAEWDEVVTEAAVPLSGDDVVITLLATAAPASHTAEVHASVNAGYGWSAYTDITGDLSPALTTPPTSSTDYTWDSDYPVATPTPGQESFYTLISFAFRAIIKNGSGDAIDTYEFYLSYYTI